MEQQSVKPLLIELDDKSWDAFCDNAAKWFDNLLLMQSSYRKLLKDTEDKVAELHIKAYLNEMHERAEQHEEKIEELYRIVGRDDSVIRKTLGTVLGKAREVLGVQ